jgi:hypothetical protein
VTNEQLSVLNEEEELEEGYVADIANDLKTRVENNKRNEKFVDFINNHYKLGKHGKLTLCSPLKKDEISFINSMIIPF